MVAGPAWLSMGPVPTKSPAPMIPPSEIMVMCRLFRPGCSLLLPFGLALLLRPRLGHAFPFPKIVSLRAQLTR